MHHLALLDPPSARSRRSVREVSAGRRAAGRATVAAAAFALALVVAACSGASGPTPPPASAVATPAPSSNPGSVPTQAEAVAKVLAMDPRFAGIGALDPNLIGASAWYEVSPAVVGWRVVITKGWGDCPAGCINRHSWTYDVGGDGVPTLVGETGDPLPDDSPGPGAGGGLPGEGGGPASPPVAIPADGGPWIAGRAFAGPVCPVVQKPPDPACADRPVAGAEVVIRSAAGADIARVTTAADGTFLVAVPGGGSYSVEAQPVEGLMGTPSAVTVDVDGAPSAWAEALLAYDTGIR